MFFGDLTRYFPKSKISRTYFTTNYLIHLEKDTSLYSALSIGNIVLCLLGSCFTVHCSHNTGIPKKVLRSSQWLFGGRINIILPLSSYFIYWHPYIYRFSTCFFCLSAAFKMNEGHFWSKYRQYLGLLKRGMNSYWLVKFIIWGSRCETTFWYLFTYLVILPKVQCIFSLATKCCLVSVV